MTAAKIGGDVIADVVIRADGSVESVTMVAGAEPLRGPVAAALRRWRFRPVLVGGRASRVVTLITIAFADPTGTRRCGSTRRISPSGINASASSRARRVRRSPSAPSSCDCPTSFPPIACSSEATLSICSAQSLVMGGRVAEGLAQLERGIEIRIKKTGPDDAGLAGSYRMLALVHHAMKDLTKADEVFALSARMYERAIERLPPLRALYVPSLRVTLLDHAAVKRLLGQPEAAQALELRAAGLAAPATVAVTPMRVLDSVPVIGEAVSRLGDDDVRQIERCSRRRRPVRGSSLRRRRGARRAHRRLQWWIHVHLAPMSPRRRCDAAVSRWSARRRPLATPTPREDAGSWFC